MSISQFVEKVQKELHTDPIFTLGELYDGVIRCDLKVGDLAWFGIGINEKDAKNSVVSKARKYFKWD